MAVPFPDIRRIQFTGRTGRYFSGESEYSIYLLPHNHVFHSECLTAGVFNWEPDHLFKISDESNKLFYIYSLYGELRSRRIEMDCIPYKLRELDLLLCCVIDNVNFYSTYSLDHAMSILVRYRYSNLSQAAQSISPI